MESIFKNDDTRIKLKEDIKITSLIKGVTL